MNRSCLAVMGLLIGLSISPSQLGAQPASRPSIAQVLDQYSATQRALERCVVIVDAQSQMTTGSGKESWVRARSEYRRLNDRAQVIYVEKVGNREMPSELPAPDDTNADDFDYYISAVNSPQGVTAHRRYLNLDKPEHTVYIEAPNGEESRQLGRWDIHGAWMRGWVTPMDELRLDDVLRGASKSSISPTSTPGDGDDCYVIQGEALGGNYQVYFDMSRGGNIIRARIERHSLDLVRGKPLWEIARSYLDQGDPQRAPEHQPFDDHDETVSDITEISGVELSQEQGVWLPAAMSVMEDMSDRLGRHSITHLTLRRTKLDLSPTFAADVFTMDVPDGSAVYVRQGDSFDPTPRVWRNGGPTTVVDQQGVNQNGEAARTMGVADDTQESWRWLVVFAAAAAVVVVIALVAGRRSTSSQKR